MKICDPTCGARPLNGSAWAVRIKQRAESILGIDILLAVARLCTEELIITEPSLLSLHRSLILKEKVTLSRNCRAWFAFFHTPHINLSFSFFPITLVFPLSPEGNFLRSRFYNIAINFLRHDLKWIQKMNQ